MAAKLAKQMELALTTIEVFALVPAQLPDQPAKVEPAAAAAVRVTAVFCTKLTAQTPPHDIPSGAEVTVPPPVPVRVTVNVYWVGTGVKLAVQLAFALTITVALTDAPEQLPVHPANVAPAAAVAVSVTAVPCAKVEAQMLPQAIPAGNELTLPEPVPANATLRVYAGVEVISAKLAWQVVERDLRRTFAVDAVPLHAPLHPLKLEPAPGVTVRLTVVFFENRAVQVLPQDIPAGADITTPAPVPILLTVRSTAAATPGSKQARANRKQREKIACHAKKLAKEVLALKLRAPSQGGRKKLRRPDCDRKWI